MNFKEEYRALLKQTIDKVDELEEKNYKLRANGKLEGKDGGYSTDIRNEWVLYKEKVKGLKKKYNVD